MIPGAVYQGLKRPELEVDNSSLSSAEVKNEWGYTLVPVICFMVWAGTLLLFNNIMVTVRLFDGIVGCDSYVEIQLQILYSIGTKGGEGSGKHVCLFCSTKLICLERVCNQKYRFVRFKYYCGR